MSLRRDRKHMCGLTNVDFRTKGDSESLRRFYPDLKGSNYGTMGHAALHFDLTAPVSVKEKIQVLSGLTSPKRPNPHQDDT